MDSEKVKTIIREVVTDVLAKTSQSSGEKPALKSRRLADENIARWLGRDAETFVPPHRRKQETLKKVSEKMPTPSAPENSSENLVPHPRKPEKIDAMLETSPARLGVWRAGTRYLTKVALKFRADHAVAKDAVYAELKEGFAEANGWVALQTKAKDKEEFLLRPDLGRVLSDASLKTVQEKGIKNPDVQIIVADGLSPWAADRHGKSMVDELIKLFAKEGLKVGTVFCVKYARIAVQDVIGQGVGAVVSMIILGERPGLGGGDSLSNYMIYNPKVGAVNALKSMISNIHPAGHTPVEAAHLTVSMVKKMFEQKCSGIDLKI